MKKMLHLRLASLLRFITIIVFSYTLYLTCCVVQLGYSGQTVLGEVIEVQKIKVQSPPGDAISLNMSKTILTHTHHYVAKFRYSLSDDDSKMVSAWLPVNRKTRVGDNISLLVGESVRINSFSGKFGLIAILLVVSSITYLLYDFIKNPYKKGN